MTIGCLLVTDGSAAKWASGTPLAYLGELVRDSTYGDLLVALMHYVIKSANLQSAREGVGRTRSIVTRS